MTVESLLQEPVQGRGCFGMPFGQLRLHSHMNDGVDLLASRSQLTPPVMLSYCIQTVGV
jgi:hypothetical protein